MCGKLPKTNQGTIDMPNQGKVCHHCKGKLEGDYSVWLEHSIKTHGIDAPFVVYCAKDECVKEGSKDIHPIRDKHLKEIKNGKKNNLSVKKT